MFSKNYLLHGVNTMAKMKYVSVQDARSSVYLNISDKFLFSKEKENQKTLIYQNTK